VCVGWVSPSSRGLWGGHALPLSTGAAGNRNPNWKAALKAAARLALEVSAGWVSPSSLCRGHNLLLSTGAAGNRNPGASLRRCRHPRRTLLMNRLSASIRSASAGKRIAQAGMLDRSGASACGEAASLSVLAAAHRTRRGERWTGAALSAAALAA
jgi:hypothetical protein